MIKLKDILKESSPGFENRKFGDPLPTLEDIAKRHQEKNGEIKEDSFNITEAKDLDSSMISKIKSLTSRNAHNMARETLAKAMGNKNLLKAYGAINTLHTFFYDMNDLVSARNRLDKDLFKQAKKMYNNYDDIYGAF
tara:strand:+ start:93 stop:503 length:411 start_codon:yes stop_codon:yes gene_type:complete